MPITADPFSPVPTEDERLTALARYDILDTAPEEAFERITRLVRRIFDVPIATVTLLDAHRQWFKSQSGLGICETARSIAFCDLTITRRTPLVIPDARLDPRLRDNPLVTGEPHLRFYAGAPLIGPGGAVVGTLCAMDTQPREITAVQTDILIDLASIVVDELELRLLASTDSLTGAKSRRAFRENAALAMRDARRRDAGLSGLVLDLDHFKSVNDRHGHAVGDRMLTAAVEACRAVLDQPHLLGRIGGEEFAILLPGADLDEALAAADRLRSAIARVRVAGPTGSVGATVSIGVAELTGEVEDLDELLRRADAALYLAKASGRDCCRGWGPAAIGPGPSRPKVLKAGRILVGDGSPEVACTIHSLSDGGARLDVLQPLRLPGRFELRVGSDAARHACRVTERRANGVEVAFDPPREAVDRAA